MYERFTDRARKAMQLANQEAQRFNHEYIGTEHILLGLIKEGSGVAAHVLKNLNIDLRKVRMEVERIIQSEPERLSVGKLPQTPRLKKVLEYSIEEARGLNHNYVGTEHLLLGLLREQECFAARVLLNLGVDADHARNEVLALLRPQGTEPPEILRISHAPAAMADDLTSAARMGKCDPVFGRDREINRLIEVLSQRTKNNAALVGEPGVGKSAIVRGLARLMAAGQVPAPLQGRQLLALDLAVPASYTTLRSQVVDRFKETIIAAAEKKNSFVVVENLDLLDQDGFGGLEMGLVHFLDRAEIQCIATTTPSRFAQVCQKNPRLCLHFSEIAVAPLSAEETGEILRRLRCREEVAFGVMITDDALNAAATMKPDQAGAAELPGRAIERLRKAAGMVQKRATTPPVDLGELAKRIDAIRRAKEDAVAAQDFDKAARLRDEADKLKKALDQRQREWLESGGRTIVDAAAVAESASQ